MFAVDAWSIGIRTHHAEVVIHQSLVDGCRRLRDKLRSAHVLAIPVRGAIQCDFGALVTASIGRILVAGA